MIIWYMTSNYNSNKYSSRRFFEEARNLGADFSVVCPDNLEVIISNDNNRGIYRNGVFVDLPDVVIPRAGSRSYHGLNILRFLKSQGVIILNSADNLAASRDKISSLHRLRDFDIPIPKTIIYKPNLNLDIVEAEIGFPVVVKNINGSLGKGVMLCKDRESLKDLIDFMESSKTQTNFLIQEFVESSRGRDLRVFVVGDRALGSILRTSDSSFKSNISRGGKEEVFPLSKRISDLAITSAKALGLDIAGVDLLFNGEDYVVCEINSSPQFKGFESATKINVPREIFSFIKEFTPNITPRASPLSVKI